MVSETVHEQIYTEVCAYWDKHHRGGVKGQREALETQCLSRKGKGNMITLKKAVGVGRVRRLVSYYQRETISTHEFAKAITEMWENGELAYEEEETILKNIGRLKKMRLETQEVGA